MVNRLLYYFIGVLLLASCARKDKELTSILPQECKLKAGDVVFRKGSGLTSHAVIMLEKGGVYSHVGIVVDSSGVKMIVHAVPGEPDFEGDEDRVKLDTPERFFSLLNATAGEVCRYSDEATASKAAQVAMEIYRRHTLFDHNYNEEDTINMYCTQVVTHSYARAGKPFDDVPRSQLTFLNIHANCVLPSDLLKSASLHTIIKF